MKSYSILILAAAVAFSSCSTIQSLQKSLTSRGNEAEVVDHTPTAPAEKPQTEVKTNVPEKKAEKQTEKKPEKKTEKKTEKKKNNKKSSKPAAQPAPAEPTTPVVVAESVIAPKLEGEWYIISVRDVEIDRDENMPYIYFEPSKGNFYANNGCNTLNGSYKVAPGEMLEFFNVLSTMQYCPDVNFDTHINSVIAEGNSRRIALTEGQGEQFLDIFEGNTSVMRLRRGSSSFIDGHWSVESINSLEEMTAAADIFFDSRELKLHGNTGCNYFNGEIYFDHRVANAVDFSDIIITAAICPDMEQETALLVALQETTTAEADGTDRLIFYNGDGDPLLTLKRIASSR